MLYGHSAPTRIPQLTRSSIPTTPAGPSTQFAPPQQAAALPQPPNPLRQQIAQQMGSAGMPGAQGPMQSPMQGAPNRMMGMFRGPMGLAR
jgi:hypothetical protein